jgi:hypothetical protein
MGYCTPGGMRSSCPADNEGRGRGADAALIALAHAALDDGVNGGVVHQAAHHVHFFR